MTWKIITLRELNAGLPLVVPACALGVNTMAKMVRDGLFVREFPPDSGDCICLEIDGELSEFCVYRVRDLFHCEEIREANPRQLRHSEDELTMHTLVRKKFYEIMAADLGVTGQVIEVGNGLWELGRKKLPGRDTSKVIFLDSGVTAAVLELTLMRDPFKTLCLLHQGDAPLHDWHSDKTLIRGTIEVCEDRYASDVFEDLLASQRESSADTRIELDEHPPKLWICGEEFKLPADRGRPTLGVLNLSYLFENPRTPISCWDIERAVNPKLRELTSEAHGSDTRLDKEALRALEASIKEASINLEEVMRDPSASQFERDEAQSELDQLLERKQADIGKGGKSRLLSDTDQVKARGRVRKAIRAVIEYIANQNPVMKEPLLQAIDTGTEIYFNPPPDWNI